MNATQAKEDWLSKHKVTKCPTRYAMGISLAEKLFGMVSVEGPKPKSWGYGPRVKRVAKPCR